MTSFFSKLTAAAAVAALLVLPASAAAQAPPSQPTTPPEQSAQPQPPAAQAPAGEQAARQHLTAARNTLSEITQLPAAAQLTGETRTQVAQLISNFNELITAKSEWRATYAKVNANLTALIGPDVGTPDPSGAPGTAVGTSGTPAASLDPEIRSRLVQLRQHLSEFEKAAGGGAAQSATAATSTPTDPSVPPTAPPSTPPSTTPPSTTPPSTTPPSTTPPSTAPPATTPPSTTPPATEPTPQGTTGTMGVQPTGNAEIMRHIAAIEALIKTEDDSGGLTLTKMQLEQLRAHLAGLRQAVDKK